jgi:Arc/MetJ family transcription regulator
MKTKVEVDDALIADALQATGLEATDQVIEIALKLLVQLKRQESIKAFRGQLRWEGDLAALRADA